MFLPYIKGISVKISRACKPLGVQLVFTSRNTLRKSLTKGRPGMIDVKGVVYSIPCAECSATYVGETGRTLRVRMAEYRRAVKNKDPKMELPCMSKRLRIPSTGRKQRSLESLPRIFAFCQLARREGNWGRRRVLEALVIQQRRPMMISLDPS